MLLYCVVLYCFALLSHSCTCIHTCTRHYPGASVPPPRPSQPNPDYSQCPHCERRFEQYAAERHIPFCKEQHSRIDRRASDNKAMTKLNKRTQVLETHQSTMSCSSILHVCILYINVYTGTLQPTTVSCVMQ